MLARKTARQLARRWAPSAAEAVLAITVTVVFALSAADIGGNPLIRVNQVSALAAMQLRLAVLAIVVLGVVAWFSQRGPRRYWELVVRLSAATAAGAAGGFLGAGQVYALHGTPWGILGQSGDEGRMILWSQQILKTGTFQNIYPPGFPRLGAFIARYFYDDNVPMAYKPMLIMLLALAPALVYLAWRMVVRPLPAAGIAILGGILDAVPGKPWTTLVAMLLVPVFAKLTQWLRASPGFSVRGAALRGLWLGLMCAVLFLFYSGWHMWSALGVAGLVLVVFPWRRAGNAGRVRGLALLAGFGAGMLITIPYALVLFGASASTKDLYCTSWTLTDPAATVFNFSLMGSPWPWLLLGIGLSVFLGLRKPAVLATLLVFGGVWVTRFLFASEMAKSGNIRLFPHTGIELQYLLVVLLVLGVAQVAERVHLKDVHFGHGAIAVLVVLFLGAGVGASSISDTAMPSPNGPGGATWMAHQLARPDNGECPTYAVKGKCKIMPYTPAETDVPSSGPLPCPKYGYTQSGVPITKP